MEEIHRILTVAIRKVGLVVAHSRFVAVLEDPEEGALAGAGVVRLQGTRSRVLLADRISIVSPD